MTGHSSDNHNNNQMLNTIFEQRKKIITFIQDKKEKKCT
uniref:Uncharacterized protein n=1 Tax=Anguilla anguilla TaxID=7936 RepID=A0A0E9WEN3_ANGAN